MKEIKLTKGYVALVDDEDFDYLRQWKWHVDVQKWSVYAVRASIKEGKTINVLMHRALLNPPIGVEIDHIDRNGLNNQRGNLRVCTHSQNSMNRKYKNASGYIGVYYHYDNLKSGIKKRIYSCIKVNGIQIYLGSFITETDAATAYDNAAIS